MINYVDQIKEAQNRLNADIEEAQKRFNDAIKDISSSEKLRAVSSSIAYRSGRSLTFSVGRGDKEDEYNVECSVDENNFHEAQDKANKLYKAVKETEKSLRVKINISFRGSRTHKEIHFREADDIILRFFPRECPWHYEED